MKIKRVKESCLIVSILLFLACASEPKPKIYSKNIKGILPKDTFMLLLKDIYLVEGHFYQGSNEVYNSTKASSYFSSILSKYSCSKEKLEKSLHYYQQDPKEMMEMYDEIMEYLSIDEAALEKPIKVDTLKK